MDQISFCEANKDDIENSLEAIEQAKNAIENASIYSGINNRIIWGTVGTGSLLAGMVLLFTSGELFPVSIIVTVPVFLGGSVVFCDCLIDKDGRGHSSNQIKMGEKRSEKYPEIKNFQGGLRQAISRMEVCHTASEISNYLEDARNSAGSGAKIECEYIQDESGKDVTGKIRVYTTDVNITKHIGAFASVTETREGEEKGWEIPADLAEKIFLDDKVDFSWVDGEAREAAKEAQKVIETYLPDIQKITGEERLCLPGICEVHVS